MCVCVCLCVCVCVCLHVFVCGWGGGAVAVASHRSIFEKGVAVQMQNSPAKNEVVEWYGPKCGARGDDPFVSRCVDTTPECKRGSRSRETVSGQSG